MYISSMTTLPFGPPLKRLLNKAGYDLRHIRLRRDCLRHLPDETQTGVHIIGRPDTPGLSGPDLQTQLNQRGSTLPDYFPHRTSYTQDDRADGQGGRARLSDQASSSDELLPAIQSGIGATRSVLGLGQKTTD